MKKQNIFIILFFITVIVLIATQVFYKINQSKERTIINIPVENCHPQIQSCKVKFKKISFDISLDDNIYYLKLFNVSVLTENLNSDDIKSIDIDFKMKNMDMGINRFQLKKSDLKNRKQFWFGKALLPVCVAGRADWFSELEVVTKDSKYILTIPVLVKLAKD